LFKLIGRLQVMTVSKSNLKLTTADFCADAGTETSTNATEISNTADLRISSSHVIFSALLSACKKLARTLELIF
jgi:hypothetical protein